MPTRHNNRRDYAAHLLHYHGGGGSAVYALGSFTLGSSRETIPYDLIRDARDELLRDSAKPYRPGYGSKWLSTALRLVAAELTRWMQTGIAPWADPSMPRHDVRGLQFNTYAAGQFEIGPWYETPNHWEVRDGDEWRIRYNKQAVRGVCVDQDGWIAPSEAERVKPAFVHLT